MNYPFFIHCFVYYFILKIGRKNNQKFKYLVQFYLMITSIENKKDSF
jgi:hypothetical protein